VVIELLIVFFDAPTMTEWVEAGEDYALEDCYYNLAPMLGFAFAAVIGLFIGTEYSDGILRNKLMAGHGRTAVFLSFFLTSAIACLLMTAVCLISGLAGLSYLGFGFGWGTFALYGAMLVCSSLLFAAVYTALSMLIGGRAVGIVVSVALWLAMLFLGSAAINALEAPRMTCDYAWVNGQYVAGASYPNPAYVGGALRVVLQVIRCILPICPAIDLAGGTLTQPVMYIVSSLGMTAIVLAAGCLIFRRKDLK